MSGRRGDRKFGESRDGPKSSDNSTSVSHSSSTGDLRHHHPSPPYYEPLAFPSKPQTTILPFRSFPSRSRSGLCIPSFRPFVQTSTISYVPSLFCLVHSLSTCQPQHFDIIPYPSHSPFLNGFNDPTVIAHEKKETQTTQKRSIYHIFVAES